MQRWRRALHVPLRLDVYYQHASSDGSANGEPQRELLERWALEYLPHHKSYDQSAQQYDSFMLGNSNDPIVQLRHVCKKIVIWLRTLYCLARFLPAAAAASPAAAANNNGKVGFSIYVVSEEEEELPMFMLQTAPSRVYTPYGEIGWKVWYAPKHVTERWIPRQPTATWRMSAARPIPTHMTQQQQRSPQALQYAQSAPTRGILIPPQQQQQQLLQHYQPLPIKQKSDQLSPLPVQGYGYQAARSPIQRPRSYYPERELPTRQTRPPVLRSLSSVEPDHHVNEGIRVPIQRAHSGIECTPPLPQPEVPQLVLSGLSLALMSEVQDQNAEASTQNGNEV